MRDNVLKFAPRYELLFALDSQTADALKGSTSHRMLGEALNQSVSDSYYESSDTKAKMKAKSARRRQYRVRRVDRSWDVFMQGLSWDRELCSLRQTVVPSSELAKLQSDVVDKSWAGKWYHKKLIKHQLSPSLGISFDRSTWTNDSLEGPIQLTIDRNIQAASLTKNTSGVGVSTSIIRMKFSVSLPSIFKALIYEFALLPEQPTVLLDVAKAKTRAVDEHKSVPAPATFGSTQEVETCQFG